MVMLAAAGLEKKKHAQLLDLSEVCPHRREPFAVVELFGYPYRLLWRDGDARWWCYRLRGLEWFGYMAMRGLVQPAGSAAYFVAGLFIGAASGLAVIAALVWGQLR